MITVQQQDFDMAAEYNWLRQQADNPGAIATFTGLVRELYSGNDTPEDRVTGLFLEHYPGMTEKALAEIVAEAAGRWDVQAARVIHRVGELAPGDQIVFVGIASAHRGDAFAATEFIMDYLKTRAPFWKKQRSVSGSEWIESRDSDHQAAARWQKS